MTLFVKFCVVWTLVSGTIVLGMVLGAMFARAEAADREAQMNFRARVILGDDARRPCTIDDLRRN